MQQVTLQRNLFVCLLLARKLSDAGIGLQPQSPHFEAEPFQYAPYYAAASSFLLCQGNSDKATIQASKALLSSCKGHNKHSYHSFSRLGMQIVSAGMW